MSQVIPFILNVGASLLASALGRPKNNTPLRDSSPPSLSERGSYLPRVFGTQRVSPVIAWVGDRESKKEKAGGGSGGSAQTTGYSYKESAWHQLCMGPGFGLGSIRDNGKLIFKTFITRDDTPSGTSFEATDGSHFRIYWGDRGQPVDNYLAAQIGVRSHWSYCMYVVWDKKELGHSVGWPQVTYDVTCKVPNSTLSGSSAWLDNDPGSAKNNGVNPAHALWQALTAGAPVGCGIPAYLLDAAAFEALGVLLESEKMSLNTAVADGMTATELAAQLMQDYGFVLPQVRWLLTPKPVRPIDAADLPTLVNDAIEAIPQQVENLYPQAPTRRVYTFKNRLFNYRPDAINIDDDGVALNFNRHKTVSVPINSTIDPRTANAIAQRRAHEDRLDRGAFQIRANRDAVLLSPGDAFILEGLGQLRVGTMQRSFTSGAVTLNCDVDEFSGLPGSYVPDDVDDDRSAPDAAEPLPDLAFAAAQVPGEAKIVVARVRASTAIAGANVWVSPDGTTYQLAGQQDAYAAGGTLNSPIDDDPADLDPGPTITTDNGDVGNVQDLSADATSWAAGVQLCLIDQEVMFLQYVEAVSGGYKLRGLKRGQFGTTVATHAVNAKVLIIDRADLVPQFTAIMTAGATIYVKTQPRTASGAAVDLSDVTPVTITLA